MNYDIEYYENMLRIYSKSAEEICRIRWKWISILKPKVVLDYGSGVGWFRAWRPEGIQVDSFDIADYPQTGVKLRIYDVTCFWDVLEHIPDFSKIEPILALSKAVAGSIPIKPENYPYKEWKHFKILEHLHFFTEETLCAFFEKCGFQKLLLAQPECPPRQDILSFIFIKNKQNGGIKK